MVGGLFSHNKARKEKDFSKRDVDGAPSYTGQDDPMASPYLDWIDWDVGRSNGGADGGRRSSSPPRVGGVGAGGVGGAGRAGRVGRVGRFGGGDGGGDTALPPPGRVGATTTHALPPAIPNLYAPPNLYAAPPNLYTAIPNPYATAPPPIFPPPERRKTQELLPKLETFVSPYSELHSHQDLLKLPSSLRTLNACVTRSVITDWRHLPSHLTKLSLRSFASTGIHLSPPTSISNGASSPSQSTESILPDSLTDLRILAKVVILFEHLPRALTRLQLDGEIVKPLSDARSSASTSASASASAQQGNETSFKDDDFTLLPSRLLQLTLGSFSSTSTITSRCLSLLPRGLEKLTIKGEMAFESLDHLPPLLSLLHLPNISSLNPSSFIPLLPRYITNLDLGSISSFTDDHFSSPLPPYLRHLNLSSAKLITDKIAPLLPRQLLTLIIKDNGNFSFASVPSFPPFIDLIELGYSGVTDKYISERKRRRLGLAELSANVLPK